MISSKPRPVHSPNDVDSPNDVPSPNDNNNNNNKIIYSRLYSSYELI